MKKLFFITVMLICSFSFAQTITAAPIFDSGRTTIKELDSGVILMTYQDLNYKQIVKLESLNFTNSKEATKFYEEAIRILKMEKTKKDQDIKHSFSNYQIIRYGFSQKAIFINNTLKTNEKFLKKYISALKNYQYQSEVNKL